MWLFCGALALAPVASSRGASAPTEPLADPVEQYSLPVPEISGMCWRYPEDPKRRELLVVGDGGHDLGVLRWAERGNSARFRSIDLSGLFPADGRQSQWESIYSDASGKMFLLREFPALIHVLSEDLSKVARTLELRLSEAHARELRWEEEPNSLGEGFLLLKNGHILLLKEKRPVALVELAPSADATPEGYRPELSLERKGVFPMPPAKAGLVTAYRSVKTWRLASDQEARFGDASGIDVGRDGRLYVLSDQSRRVGRLADLSLRAGATFRAERSWDLPPSFIKPEGMVFDGEGRVVIALDRKRGRKRAGRPNLFVLPALR